MVAGGAVVIVVEGMVAVVVFGELIVFGFEAQLVPSKVSANIIAAIFLQGSLIFTLSSGFVLAGILSLCLVSIQILYRGYCIMAVNSNSNRPSATN